jgi:hypothetical protein
MLSILSIFKQIFMVEYISNLTSRWNLRNYINLKAMFDILDGKSNPI